MAQNRIVGGQVPLKLSEKRLDKFVDTLEELDKEQLKLLWYWAVLKWAYLWGVDVRLGRL